MGVEIVKPTAVCVFCASSPRAPKHYTDAAFELGVGLAQAGITTVYGGGMVGLMGALADGALSQAGRVVGVRPEFISELERAHTGVEEMIFNQTMHQRKQLMVDRSDAFVALPGAIGTLDEVVEAITWRRLGLHNHPICVLNVDGFFDALRAQFQRMVDDAMIPKDFLEMVGYAPDAAGVLSYLALYESEPAAALLWEDD